MSSSTLTLTVSVVTDSDVVSLRFLGTPVIVLNSVKPANDLFEKRSAIYSDRSVVPWYYKFRLI